MKTEKNIQDKVEQTFNVLEAMDKASVSPFFKDQTMRRLFTEEEKQNVWPWFTPKLQFGILVAIVVLNFLAFTQTDSDSISEDAIEDFVTTYELSDEDESSLFY